MVIFLRKKWALQRFGRSFTNATMLETYSLHPLIVRNSDDDTSVQPLASGNLKKGAGQLNVQ